MRTHNIPFQYQHKKKHLKLSQICSYEIFPKGLKNELGAPVAQWVKRWPTDLAVPSSIPARGEIFSTVNGVPLHTAFQYHLPIVLI